MVMTLIMPLFNVVCCSHLYTYYCVNKLACPYVRVRLMQRTLSFGAWCVRRAADTEKRGGVATKRKI